MFFISEIEEIETDFLEKHSDIGVNFKNLIEPFFSPLALVIFIQILQIDIWKISIIPFSQHSFMGWLWELNSIALEEQSVLLIAELSLQTPMG